jgi:hypothetical protein
LSLTTNNAKNKTFPFAYLDRFKKAVAYLLRVRKQILAKKALSVSAIVVEYVILINVFAESGKKCSLYLQNAFCLQNK